MKISTLYSIATFAEACLQHKSFKGFRNLLRNAISKNRCCACQGFNRIAAIALLFLNEEDAFWLMVYIIDVVMPSNYYTKQLLGAQVDILYY